jgi:hypothetical protein
MSGSKAAGSPEVSKIADVTNATLLNGMIKLPHANKLLIADSVLGVVFGLDLDNSTYDITINDPLMKPVSTSPFPLGINGIRLGRNNELFFTNTFNYTFNRVPILDDGYATGPAVTIAKESTGDDFALDKYDNAYVTQNGGNEILKITHEGNVSVVVGNLNSTQIVGPTSAQFGRTNEDNRTLYITTNGGLALPVNGTFIEGGMLVALSL